MLQSDVPVASTALNALSPPRWVGAGSGKPGQASEPWGPAVRTAAGKTASGEFAYVSRRIAAATALDAPGLELAVARAYGDIAAQLERLNAPFPVRFWNYIPDIHGQMGNGLTRYMAFNAGRYKALVEWLGGAGQLEQKVTTATGVGHAGEDLYVYCLASQTPGRPIENPRQVPAYRYSRKFGPMPPCFARATVVRTDGREALLVGGTASVCGEKSVNGDDIEKQLLETFVNLATLVRTGCAGRTGGEEPADSRWLGRFKLLRAYCVHADYDSLVRSMIQERFAGLATLEILRAQVCRPELLVEIEGVAEIPHGDPSR